MAMLSMWQCAQRCVCHPDLRCRSVRALPVPPGALVHVMVQLTSGVHTRGGIFCGFKLQSIFGLKSAQSNLGSPRWGMLAAALLLASSSVESKPCECTGDHLPMVAFLNRNLATEDSPLATLIPGLANLLADEGITMPMDLGFLDSESSATLAARCEEPDAALRLLQTGINASVRSKEAFVAGCVKDLQVPVAPCRLDFGSAHRCPLRRERLLLSRLQS